jgi:hypothetical protein
MNNGSSYGIPAGWNVWFGYPTKIGLMITAGYLLCLQVERNGRKRHIATFSQNCHFRIARKSEPMIAIDGKTKPFIKMIAAGP